MPIIAELIVRVIDNVAGEKGEIDENVVKDVIADVKALTERFPLYSDLVRRSDIDV